MLLVCLTGSSFSFHITELWSFVITSSPKSYFQPLPASTIRAMQRN